MITIQELLYNRGLDPKDKIKLVRHKDNRLDLYTLYRYEKHKFLDYQCCQSQDVFKGVDYIVSFIGEEGKFARFIGVFKVLQKRIDGERFWYEMEEDSGYADLKERVIINWGDATISWHQWLANQKEVIQIHPGLHYKQFTDYFDFVVDYKELEEIISNAYNDWKKVLTITKGVYLINDLKTGKLYVGSAYGDEGIWGRWRDYVKTKGHGNNKALISLLETDPNYCYNFQFSILMLLPKTVTAAEAIRKEGLFKLKLGSNSFGLNEN